MINQVAKRYTVCKWKEMRAAKWLEKRCHGRLMVGKVNILGMFGIANVCFQTIITRDIHSQDKTNNYLVILNIYLYLNITKTSSL